MISIGETAKRGWTKGDGSWGGCERVPPINRWMLQPGSNRTAYLEAQERRTISSMPGERSMSRRVTTYPTQWRLTFLERLCPRPCRALKQQIQAGEASEYYNRARQALLNGSKPPNRQS